jgi:hypothetical protein
MNAAYTDKYHTKPLTEQQLKVTFLISNFCWGHTQKSAYNKSNMYELSCRPCTMRVYHYIRNVTLQVHLQNTRHNSCISAPKFLIHVHHKLLKSMINPITSNLSSFRNTSIFISKLAKTNLNSLFHTDIRSRRLHHLLSSL